MDSKTDNRTESESRIDDDCFLKLDLGTLDKKRRLFFIANTKQGWMYDGSTNTLTLL